MDRIIQALCKAGYAYDAAVIMAECYEYDHPTMQHREETKENVERVFPGVQPQPDGPPCR